MCTPKICIEEMLDSAADGSGDGPPSDDHLRNLKALTEKLRLETRRPSYLEWKAKLEGLTWRSHPKPPEAEEEGSQDEKLTESIPLREVQVHINGSSPQHPVILASEKVSGFENIDEALNWLRKELVSIFLVIFDSFLLFVLFIFFMCTASLCVPGILQHYIDKNEQVSALRQL